MLEVGPGSGFTAFRLARTIQHLTLVEVAPEAVSALSEALRDLPNVQLVRADVTSPDFSELLGQGFDAVYGLDVFEYVLDPAACLANLAAVLRAGGEMLLTYPNVPPPIGDGVTWFTQPGDLDRLLRQAGFRRWQVLTVRLRPAAGWLYSALHEWPLRLYRHLRGSSPDDRPQTYDRTWAFRHRQHLLRYRLPLHVVWAMLGGMIRLGGDVFEAEPATNDILGRQLMIRAWR
jgi:SAM-dependent methyltransferase